jgi:uncharacterized protein with GYD domain
MYIDGMKMPFANIKVALLLGGAIVVQLALVSQRADASAVGQVIANQYQQANFQDYLDNLLFTHDGDNRGLNGADHDPCRENIFATFQSYGLTVELDPFQYNGQTYFNVVATKTGWKFPNSQYIIGAHYDSVNNPGADDDASGVAAMLEIAHVLSQYQNAHTLKFIAFDREEQGKIGSTAYVAEHTGEDIKAMVQMDMITHDAGQNKENMYGNSNALSLKQALTAAITLYGNGLQSADAGNATFSDHAPFAAAGYKAVAFVEYSYVTNSCYHQQCDSVDTANYIQYAMGANLGRSVAGFLVDNAGVSKLGDVDNNGVVNTADLLTIINGWGTCASPCPPHCIADISPFPNGDCQVNVADLLMVINNWG